MEGNPAGGFLAGGFNMNCTSCGINIETQKNWVEFSCPSCGKSKIIRCERCRKIVNNYQCKSCKFKGP